MCERAAVRDPQVSVVIPTYNRAGVLGRAVQSALHQTLRDVEVLVVDDGSTDRTAHVVRSIADERVRYIRLDVNRGVSAARNRGMREAKGSFIALLDSDDEWFPRKLELQVDRFEALHTRVGLLYTGVETVRSDGSVVRNIPKFRGSRLVRLLRSNFIHGTSSVMFRREVFHAIGGFEEDIPAIEDYDYWVRIAEYYDFDFVEQVLVRYHDPNDADRKSLDISENLEARTIFFDKHAVALRKMGLAHHFLFVSARRQLHRGCWRPGEARSLVLRGLRIRPFSIRGYLLLVRSILPFGFFSLVARHRPGRRSR